MSDKFIKMKPFVILKDASRYDALEDDNYKIPPSYGVGRKWKGDDGDKYESILTSSSMKEGKRTCRLEESNFLGSIGAMHYYATIQFYSPDIYNHSKKKLYSCSGYGEEYGKIKEWIPCGSIQAKRRLKKLEKDMYGELIGKVGDMTGRFNSKEDAVKGGIETFKLRFAPGWVLTGWNEDEEQIKLAETLWSDASLDDIF